MNKIKRGNDAADPTNRPKQDRDEPKGKSTEKQDEPNYDRRVDDGKAIDPSDISSANDE